MGTNKYCPSSVTEFWGNLVGEHLEQELALRKLHEVGRTHIPSACNPGRILFRTASRGRCGAIESQLCPKMSQQTLSHRAMQVDIIRLGLNSGSFIQQMFTEHLAYAPLFVLECLAESQTDMAPHRRMKSSQAVVPATELCFPIFIVIWGITWGSCQNVGCDLSMNFRDGVRFCISNQLPDDTDVIGSVHGSQLRL